MNAFLAYLSGKFGLKTDYFTENRYDFQVSWKKFTTVMKNSKLLEVNAIDYQFVNDPVL